MNDFNVIYPPQEPVKQKVTLKSVKRELVRFDKKGRYQLIFYVFTCLVFIVCLGLFFLSDLSLINEILKSKVFFQPIYFFNKLLQFLVPLGLILLVCVELVALWKNKSLDIHHLEMISFIIGYGFLCVYLIFIGPFIRYLTIFLRNQDPFKIYNTSTQVISTMKLGFAASTLSIAVICFSAGFIIILCKKFKFTIRRSWK